MSETNHPQRSLWKGLLAGLIAGVAATAAKSLAEKYYPPRVHGEPEPPGVLAEKLAGHTLHGDELAVAPETIHWGFGASAGGCLRRARGVLPCSNRA